METNQPLVLHCLVELMGRGKMAGTVSDQTIGGASFVRVDVPETKTQGAFTRFLNPAAIYAINPCTEEVMKHMAENYQQKPIDSWDIKKMNEKLLGLGKNKDVELFDNDGGPY